MSRGRSRRKKKETPQTSTCSCFDDSRGELKLAIPPQTLAPLRYAMITTFMTFLYCALEQGYELKSVRTYFDSNKSLEILEVELHHEDKKVSELIERIIQDFRLGGMTPITLEQFCKIFYCDVKFGFDESSHSWEFETGKRRGLYFGSSFGMLVKAVDYTYARSSVTLAQHLRIPENDFSKAKTCKFNLAYIGDVYGYAMITSKPIQAKGTYVYIFIADIIPNETILREVFRTIYTLNVQSSRRSPQGRMSLTISGGLSKALRGCIGTPAGPYITSEITKYMLMLYILNEYCRGSIELISQWPRLCIMRTEEVNPKFFELQYLSPSDLDALYLTLEGVAHEFNLTTCELVFALYKMLYSMVEHADVSLLTKLKIVLEGIFSGNYDRTALYEFVRYVDLCGDKCKDVMRGITGILR